MEQVSRNSANKTSKLIVTAHNVTLCVHVVDGVFSDNLGQATPNSFLISLFYFIFLVSIGFNGLGLN
jgi:hypothetical protein